MSRSVSGSVGPGGGGGSREVGAKRQQGNESREDDPPACNRGGGTFGQPPNQAHETEGAEHAPDLKADHEEVVALAYLVLIDRRVAVPKHRVSGLEIHVDDETHARDEP